MRQRRKWILLGLLVVLLGFLARPAFHLARAWIEDPSEVEPVVAGHADDASRMNTTRVAETVAIPADPEAAERQLVELLARARRDGLRVSIAGARHSMGGHTLYPGGIMINMLPFRAMTLDTERDILRVQAGARWSEVVPYLDGQGRSVAVMQSNNDFSVGGSLSVNCHGWPIRRAPIASTVVRLRVLLADGTIVTCSAKERADLFGAVLGGYGLFGLILEAELRVVRNERYRIESTVVSAGRFMAVFAERALDREDAVMAYGRFCVADNKFLKEAILNVFYAESGDPPPLTEPGLQKLRRTVFLASAKSAFGKRLRWDLEKRFGQTVGKQHFSRNQLLNESADLFLNRETDSTDILHEYFVPPHRFEDFRKHLQEIVPRHRGNLLNVTVRHVMPDDVTLLRYADQEFMALVLYFRQPRTDAADRKMAVMTRELIDASRDVGGRYYLPYRLHATVAQFREAYPQADRFFALKRAYDPGELFQNRFYERYGVGR